jgi:hypothetical protein
MEVASSSETSVNFYQTTRRYDPEDSRLQPKNVSNVLMARGKTILTCTNISSKNTLETLAYKYFYGHNPAQAMCTAVV